MIAWYWLLPSLAAGIFIGTQIIRPRSWNSSGVLMDAQRVESAETASDVLRIMEEIAAEMRADGDPWLARGGFFVGACVDKLRSSMPAGEPPLVPNGVDD